MTPRHLLIVHDIVMVVALSGLISLLAGAIEKWIVVPPDLRRRMPGAEFTDTQ